MIPRDHAAYHEAGHAVIAAMLRIPVARVTIRPQGDSGGRTEIEEACFLAAPVDDRVMVYLAGVWGELMIPGGSPEDLAGGGTDLHAAQALACLDGPEWRAYLQARMVEVGGLIHQDHAERALHALAGMLMERTEVAIATDTEAAEILIHLRP
jgi:Peptidase family M41